MRPLLYPVKVVTPMDEAQSRATLTFWRNAAIISAPTTEPAKAIKTRDMEEVEDLADDAPPTHSDDTTHIGQTEKYQQEDHI